MVLGIQRSLELDESDVLELSTQEIAFRSFTCEMSGQDEGRFEDFESNYLIRI